MNILIQNNANMYRSTHAEQLQEIYVSLLGGMAISGENDRPDLATIWDELGYQATIEQGTIRGSFGPDDVLLELGSSPGGHITISTETGSGIKEVQLGLRGSEPDFIISTLPTQ